MANYVLVNYVLVNNSTRLIHVPTGKGLNETTALIPGAVHKLDIAKENDAFFKATIKGVPGLNSFTEKAYDEYVAGKAAAEAALNAGTDGDDEPVKTDAVPNPDAPAAPADKPSGWVS